ncbi:MAG: hypothetical protein J6A89_07335 [Clostridia bacterium]|nr:hypothetical protein [Clostridia bacterium]
MRKLSQIIIAISILMFTTFNLYNYSFAVNITTTENTTEQSSNQRTTRTTTNQTSNQTSNQTTGQITTTVSSTTSAEEGILSVTNIINILLIAVGVVIIFLGVAILVKLKK